MPSTELVRARGSSAQGAPRTTQTVHSRAAGLRHAGDLGLMLVLAFLPIAFVIVLVLVFIVLVFVVLVFVVLVFVVLVFVVLVFVVLVVFIVFVSVLMLGAASCRRFEPSWGSWWGR